MVDLKAPLRIDIAGGWIDIPKFHELYSGYVVNIAIAPHITRKDGKVDFSPYLPGGGVSSSTGALSLGLLSLLAEFSTDHKVHCSPSEFAETVFRMEDHKINFKIGRQDPYAIILGGINFLRFGNKGFHAHNFEVETHISETDSDVRTLEKKLLLVHSGVSREAQNIVKIVTANIDSGKKVYRQALETIGTCGETVTRLIQTQQFDDRLAYAMSENWEAQKQLAPESSNAKLDMVYSKIMQSGAVGGKMCGAGGGGYFVFYCRDREGVMQTAKKMGLQVIEPRFEMRDILTLNNLNPENENSR